MELIIKRLLTAIVALPLLILLILKGGFFLFACFTMLLSFLGLAEFFRMALPERQLEVSAASLLEAPLPPEPTSPDQPHFLSAITTVVLFSALLFLFRFSDIRYTD